MKEKRFWIGLYIILLVVCLALIRAATNRYLETRSQLDDSQDKIEQLERDIVWLKEENVRIKNGVLLDPFEIGELEESGLENPVEALRGDLENHTELIPYEAVLGGTMYFNEIDILSPQWVIAKFSDGHIGGQTLLKYEISESGIISWQTLDSALE